MAETFGFFIQLAYTIGVPLLLVRLLSLWLDRKRQEPTKPVALTLPASLAFDWHRDYGPLWEPGSTAFWLEPEAGDIKPGTWPMPFVKEEPRHDLATQAAVAYGSFQNRHAGLYGLAGQCAYLHGYGGISQASTASGMAAYQNALQQQNLANAYHQQQSMLSGLNQAPMQFLPGQWRRVQ